MPPSFRRSIRIIALLLLGGAAAAGQEVQQHGLVFEQWIRDTFFDGYRPASPTQKWDIPPEANLRHGGIGVNPKAVRYGAAVDLGDALRQYETVEPFLLVIGFWRQEGDRKRFVNIVAPEISPERWRALWAPVTYADLLRLDELVKDPGLSVEEARKRALQIKNAPPFSQAVIQVNPKLDNHGQRRLQCSLRFGDVFTQLAPGADRSVQEAPVLWGVPFPGPIESKPRVSRTP